MTARHDAVLMRRRSPLYHTMSTCAAGTSLEYPALTVTTAARAEARDKRPCGRCFTPFGYTVPAEFQMWETLL